MIQVCVPTPEQEKKSQRELVWIRVEREKRLKERRKGEKGVLTKSEVPVAGSDSSGPCPPVLVRMRRVVVVVRENETENQEKRTTTTHHNLDSKERNLRS